MVVVVEAMDSAGRRAALSSIVHTAVDVVAVDALAVADAEGGVVAEAEAEEVAVGADDDDDGPFRLFGFLRFILVCVL